jgi:hypothetical protein
MPRQGARIRSTHCADGGIVMDIDRGKMFSLNASGSVMFQLLAKGHDEKTIVDELTQQFGISADEAKKDLHDFQNNLNAHDLRADLAAASTE